MTTPPHQPGGLIRRDMLLASGLAMTVAATPSCAQNASQGKTNEAMQQMASAKAFGAIGDGQYHPLSNRFSTLSAARQTYPFAERLDQSLDWAGIQGAINAVEEVRGVAFVPVGHYVLSDSLKVPSWITLEGESRNGTVLDNQFHPLTAPQIINKDTIAFLYVTIRNLTMHGGTHAIKINTSREVAGIVIDSITTNLQSKANITFSSMQTTMIRDCHLMDGEHGVAIDGFPCNSVHLENCRLGRHSGPSIRIRGADGFMMHGGSIEAGGARGLGTIDIETGGAYANAIHFQNVYFENTHQFLLKSRGAKTVSFRGCKMSGTGAMGHGMAAYAFDCGDDLIAFGDNHWDYPTPGPNNMLLQGANAGLYGEGNIWEERSGADVRLRRSRSFSQAEAMRGLFQVDFHEKAGRAYGTLELVLDRGDRRAAQRVEIPVEVRAAADGTYALHSTSVDNLALVTAPIGKALRIGLQQRANGDTPLSLWFSLRLVADRMTTVNVSVC